MSEKLKIGWVYGLTALFLIVNLFLVVEKSIFWLFLLPVALIVFYYYLTSYDKIVLLITFFTPLAVNLRDLEMGFGISLPTEPLMFGVLVLFLINLIFQSNYDKRISSHPISYLIFLNLFWILLTSLTSEYPLVSIKFFISRLWFVVPFFFVAAFLFKNPKNIFHFLWMYLIGLVIVIIYTTALHSTYGFDEETAHWVMSPFYNDHTAYGAALSMYFPIAIGLIFFPGSKKWLRFLALISLLILITAIILSYSRAAWLSIAAAFGLFLLVYFRIKYYWVLSTIVVILALFFTFQHQIIDRLEKNKQDSSANFAEHIKSMTNISSDASNLERINRWQAAIRLYDERKFMGWGPGTYQFVYAPYQRSREKTIISTNLGDMGNAHSEYLGPLAEQGFPGMIIVILMFSTILFYGIKVYSKGNKKVKFLSMMALTGLATYMAHGVLNNFLDTDKLSVPFWGFTAIIVALDIYQIKNPTKTNQLGSGNE